MYKDSHCGKLKICIYDHALHRPGGAQVYEARIAEFLQGNFDVTYLTHRPINRERFEKFAGVDISKCKFKVIKIDCFEREGPDFYDFRADLYKDINPFGKVSLETKNYDLFINAGSNESIKPLSKKSLFICHFPSPYPSVNQHYFHVNEYDHLITNSKYGALWTQKFWGIKNIPHVYPPVNTNVIKNMDLKKKNIILSVSRFDEWGFKQQDLIIEGFKRLCDTDESIKKNWELVLVGGSGKINPYLKNIKALAKGSGCKIKFRINVSARKLRKYYKKAKIYWHVCGLFQENPYQKEHFGITNVEAMNNGCVPILSNEGGHPEIVDNAKNGFLINSLEELVEKATELISDPALMARMSLNANDKSFEFSKEKFAKNINSIISKMLSS